jgi:hypothetical protein
MKQHQKRFIIEVTDLHSGKWQRSGNTGLRGFFATREEANAALESGVKSENMKYRVRQK